MLSLPLAVKVAFCVLIGLSSAKKKLTSDPLEPRGSAYLFWLNAEN